MSEARAAWLPYLPTIPKPIDANWIIPTSFPPSPIPALCYSSITLLILLIISAFGL